MNMIHARSSLVLAVLAAIGCGPEALVASGAAAPSVAASGANASAPDFALDDVAGGRFQLSDHFGKQVVLVDFWATWCDPCKAELPHLVRMYERLKERGLLVVAVSIDGPESTAQVKIDAQQLRLPFPVVLDQESRVVAAYNPRRTAPFAALIDKTGKITSLHEGYTSGDEVALEREVVELLGK